MPNLQELMDEIKESWSFDESNYPVIKNFSEEEKELFRIGHLFLHQVKATGALAEIIERREHGEELDHQELVKVIEKFFKNTIRLAEVAGMKADTLIENCMPRRFFHDPTYG